MQGPPHITQHPYGFYGEKSKYARARMHIYGSILKGLPFFFFACVRAHKVAYCARARKILHTLKKCSNYLRALLRVILRHVGRGEAICFLRWTKSSPSSVKPWTNVVSLQHFSLRSRSIVIDCHGLSQVSTSLQLSKRGPKISASSQIHPAIDDSSLAAGKRLQMTLFIWSSEISSDPLEVLCLPQLFFYYIARGLLFCSMHGRVGVFCRKEKINEKFCNADENMFGDDDEDARDDERGEKMSLKLQQLARPPIDLCSSLGHVRLHSSPGFFHEYVIFFLSLIKPRVFPPTHFWCQSIFLILRSLHLRETHRKPGCPIACGTIIFFWHRSYFSASTYLFIPVRF